MTEKIVPVLVIVFAAAIVKNASNFTMDVMNRPTANFYKAKRNRLPKRRKMHSLKVKRSACSIMPPVPGEQVNSNQPGWQELYITYLK